MTFSWPDILTDLVNARDLSPEATSWAMDEILSGNVPEATMAAFMVALRCKGETETEIRALTDSMLAKATPITLPSDAVDIVGSGGDRANTVNISTMAALVAAGAGAKVVKHGNRAASSRCGTADCLEALGGVLTVKPENQQAILDQCGFVFLFAPMYHGSLRHIGPTRKQIGIQTTFNFLGPLANPAKPNGQAIGVADAAMADLVAQVLASRGNYGLVFHGTDGLDELTTTSPSDVWVINDGQVQKCVVDPRKLGIASAELSQLVGGDPKHNAQIVRGIVNGQTGPIRDIVVLNAAAALLAYRGPKLGESNDSTGLESQMSRTIEDVTAAIDSGAAARVLDSWLELTRRLADEVF